MLSPNSTPSTDARRMSSQVGMLRITSDDHVIKPVAIHMRQKPSTTPGTSAGLPSTLPNDQNTVAPSTARHAEGAFGETCCRPVRPRSRSSGHRSTTLRATPAATVRATPVAWPRGHANTVGSVGRGTSAVDGREPAGLGSHSPHPMLRQRLGALLAGGHRRRHRHRRGLAPADERRVAVRLAQRPHHARRQRATPPVLPGLPDAVSGRPPAFMAASSPHRPP